MSSRLSLQRAENIFIVVSCMELFLGLLRMCQVTLPFSRYALWVFTLVYAAVAAVRHYSRQQRVLFVVLLAFGVLLYYNTGLNKGIRAVFYLYAMKDMDMRKYFKSILVVLVASTLLFAVLSSAGLIGIYMVKDIRNDRGFNGFRYSLGYESCNTLMAVAFLAMVCVFIEGHEGQPWYVSAVVTGLYVLMFYLTDSYTGFIVGAAVIAGMVCLRCIRWERWADFVFALFALSFLLMLVISVMAAFQVENGLMSQINRIISGRMTQLTVYPCDVKYALPYVENWRLFGSSRNHNDYDLGYVQIFYYYGIVPAVCYLACVAGAAVKAWRGGRAWQLVLLLGLSLYLFMESLYFSNFVPVDFLLVYSVSVLWGNYGKKEEGKIYRTI